MPQRRRRSALLVAVCREQDRGERAAHPHQRGARPAPGGRHPGHYAEEPVATSQEAEDHRLRPLDHRATVTYLIGTAVAVWTDRPWRWFAAAAFGFILFVQ